MFENSFRPAEWRDLLVPSKGKTAVQIVTLKRELESGVFPLRVWIEGPTGCGKTTLARLIAAKAGSEACNVHEIDGSEAVDFFDAMDSDFGRRKGLFGPAVWIINEAQNIKGGKSGAQRLMSIMDNMRGGILIFTTMESGPKATKALWADQTDLAVKTRCHVITYSTEGLADAIAARVLEIAKATGRDYGADAKKVLRLVQEHKNCIRATLAAVQTGALASSDDVGDALAELSA